MYSLRTPEREAIDRALVRNASNRSVASLYDISEAAVRRHKANHLPAKPLMAQAAEEVAQADDLLEQVRDLQTKTLAILKAAESAKQHRTALSAIREARSNVELLAKLLGELAEQPQINIALIEHPDYQRLEDAIFRALEHYDEARWAVAEEPKGLES